MQTRTYNVYTFTELNDKQKEKAIDNLRDINVDYEWWDSIYEDANTIGLKITSFDLDRRRHATGEFNCLGGGVQVANNILKEHGATCDTYRFAVQYLKEQKAIDEKYPNCEDEEKDDYEKHTEESGLLEEQFLSDLLEQYSDILQKEYEYLTSDAAIIETILSNGYDFTEDGKID